MPGITEKIIIRSFQKTASPKEWAKLNQWLKEDKGNTACYFQLEEVWNSKNDLTDEAIQKGWEILAKQIDLRPVGGQPDVPIIKKRIIKWTGYAAAVFVGILITSAVWMAVFKSIRTLSEPLIQHVVYNNSGVQSIVLPDQSQVWLNEYSRIVYPEQFTKEKRIVSLDGNAYFDIQKNWEKPFIVQIGETEIEVLGTEFFVEHTPEKMSSITLISGKVNLNYKNREGTATTAFLSPGEQALFDCANRNFVIQNVDTDYYIAWKDGTYRFADEPLKKIVPLLAKHYDLDIQIASSLSNKRFTGRVVPHQSIESVLLSFKKSYPIKYKITEKKIYITE